MSAEHRKYILEQFPFVATVHIYNEDTEDVWISRYTKFHKWIYPETKILIFHSEELEGQENIPGQKYADEVVFIPRQYESTSEIVEEIIKQHEEKRVLTGWYGECRACKYWEGNRFDPIAKGECTCSRSPNYKSITWVSGYCKEWEQYE
jgi:hypothetical protein